MFKLINQRSKLLIKIKTKTEIKMEISLWFCKIKDKPLNYHICSLGFNALNYLAKPIVPQATLAPAFPVFNDYVSPFLPRSS